MLDLFFQKVYAQTLSEGPLVTCGNPGSTACKLDDLFVVLNNFAGFILKVIFPALFIFGIFMIALPLLNQIGEGGENPGAIQLAKKRGVYLLWGTIFVVGAFFIIKAILAGIGFKEIDKIENTVKTSSAASYTIIERAAAQSSSTEGYFPNPLKDTTVQSIVLGLANIFVFLIIVGAVLGVIRGVLYLLTTQENPNNLGKGKKWIFRSLLAIVLVLSAQFMISLITNTVSSVFG
ncbi:MAG: hypothetical protein QG614_538 [Patescibacteria group bacterium]|nr:hypothetical protein [Patescibacteria group bacterium]